MSTDLAVQYLLGYIDEHLFEPKLSWPQHDFQVRSFSRFAALELMNRLLDHPTMDPIYIAEIFIIETELYKDLAEGTQWQLQVYVANKVGKDILNLLNRKENL